MKVNKKISIKDAEKLYKKMGETMVILMQGKFSEIKDLKEKQIDNWITVGGSSDFDKKLTIVNAWQTGVKS
jgi:hypothetical protein